MVEKKIVRTKAVINSIQIDYNETLGRTRRVLLCLAGNCTQQEEEFILRRARAHTLGLQCHNEKPDFGDFSSKVLDALTKAEAEAGHLGERLKDIHPAPRRGNATDFEV